MKCYSLVIEPRLVKEIDAMIKKHGLYSSRSDFIRDAIRQRLIEVKGMMQEKMEMEQEQEKEAEEEADSIEEALEELRYGGVH